MNAGREQPEERTGEDESSREGWLSVFFLICDITRVKNPDFFTFLFFLVCLFTEQVF